ncbi:MAG: YifB family Mg chelatase-like AAA ATPase [Gemmatimonadota bacterium]
MLATLRSATLRGVESLLIQVEVKVTPGLPTFSVVGLPEGAVREGRERVRAALHQVGMSLPLQRITVNLAPADVRKEGSGFDLPIALGVAAGAGSLDPARFEGMAFLGELGLNGCLRPVRGVLPVALRCRQERIGILVVPRENSREAAVVQGVRVLGAGSLAEVMEHLSGLRTIPYEEVTPGEVLSQARSELGDLQEIRGVETAKRALEVAAAGGHNLLLTGPPGTGKTLLARSLPAILPPLTLTEAVEVTAVHSVAGLLPPGAALVADRPFRAPHASISEAGLVGSGSPPRPGEVSLAHHGVLFLDELPEFRRNATEALRQPLEEGSILISRAQGAVRFPARFMLVAAMNP